MRTLGPEDATLPPEDDPDATLAASGDGAETLAGAPGPEPPPLQVGDVVGRYVIVDRLGAGGMGVVLLAHDRKLNRRVALKFVRGARHSSTTAARLEREAQAMAKLQHPHVAAVYDVGMHEGDVYLAMEYLDGGTVKSWLAEKRQPWREVLQVFIAAGRGLEAAHGEGLIHRDFKPDNMMLDQAGRVRVLDFGLARGTHEPGDTARQHSLEHGVQPGELEASSIATADLTRTGALLGTPAYMSPEQLRGRQLDPRSDQFSFCVALHEALYGARPFQGPTMVSLAAAITRGKRTEPDAEARRDVPARIHEALLRGLSVQVDDRWPSMGDLLEALEHEPPRPGRRFAIAALVVASVGGGAFAAVHYARGPEPPPPPCSGLEHHLEGVWDTERRGQLAAHFEGLGRDGKDAWRGVEPRLDAYADAWVEARAGNCRATEVQAEQSEALRDERNACLDRRKTELDALVGVLAQLDAQGVHQAVAAASKLPDLSTCDDQESLRQDPQPTDPALADRSAEVERKLADIEALRKVGQYRRALPMVHALASDARELGFGPLTARVLAEQAYVEQQSGTLDAAEAAAREAYLLAIEHGLTRIAASTSTDLVWIVGYSKEKFDAGREWGEVARAHVRATADPGLMPSLMINRGALELGAGNPDIARAIFEEGISVAQSLPPGERSDMQVATLTNNLGVALSRLDQPEAAAEAWARGLEIRRRLLGDHHPHVALSYDNLAGAAYGRGDWVLATEYANKALAIWRDSTGDDQGQLTMALDTLCQSAIAQGDAEAALRHAKEGFEGIMRSSDATDDDRAAMHDNVGFAYMAGGDWKAARREFESSLKILDETEESIPFHWRSYPLASLGRTLVELGELDEALRNLDPVIAAIPDADLDPVIIYSARFDHGRARWSSATKKQRASIREQLAALREEMALAAPPDRLRLAELDAWLEEH